MTRRTFLRVLGSASAVVAVEPLALVSPGETGFFPLRYYSVSVPINISRHATMAEKLFVLQLLKENYPVRAAYLAETLGIPLGRAAGLVYDAEVES